MRATDLVNEKKKRKKKPRWAAWGPGPYGGYGFATGYSGDGGAAPAGDGGAGGGDGGAMESKVSDERKENIKQFALWALKQLEIDQAPKIKLVDDTGTTALGYIDRETKTIVVKVTDRHQMDVMRTLAHELVHFKQMETHEPDGATGSDDENDANAIAGILLRNWGKENPDMFRQSIAEAWEARKNASI